MKTQGFGNKQLTVTQAHTANRIRSWWLLAFSCEVGKVPSQYGRIKEGIVAISEDRKRGETALLLREQDGGGGVVPKHPQRCGTRYWGALQTPPISKSGVQFVIILHPRSVFHLSFSQIKKSVAIPSFIRYYSHQNKPW